MKLAICFYSLVGLFHLVAGYPASDIADAKAGETLTSGSEMLTRDVSHLFKRAAIKETKWCTGQKAKSRGYSSYSVAKKMSAYKGLESYDFTDGEEDKYAFGVLDSQFLTANTGWKGETEHVVEAQLLGLFISYLSTQRKDLGDGKLPKLVSDHYFSDLNDLKHPITGSDVENICEYLEAWYGKGLPKSGWEKPPQGTGEVKDPVDPMSFILHALPGDSFETDEFTFLAKYPNLEKGRAWGWKALRTQKTMEKKYERQDNLKAYIETLRKFIGAYGYHVQPDVIKIFNKQVLRIGEYMQDIEQRLDKKSTQDAIDKGGNTFVEYKPLELQKRWLKWYEEYQENRRARLGQFINYWTDYAMKGNNERLGTTIDDSLAADPDDEDGPPESEIYFFRPPGAPEKGVNPKPIENNFTPPKKPNFGNRKYKRATKKVNENELKKVSKRLELLKEGFEDMVKKAQRGWGATSISDPVTPDPNRCTDY